mgnify:CR=1 FL=1
MTKGENLFDEIMAKKEAKEKDESLFRNALQC